MTTPIPTVSPHLPGDIPFDEIMQSIKDLAIYAKEYREKLEEMEELLEENQTMQTTRTPQPTPTQSIHGDLQAAALNTLGGLKTFHFYWTGNMNDAEMVHLFIEFPERNNSVPSSTFIKPGSWEFNNNTFYSLSKQEARRIWDSLTSFGFTCRNGVRKLGVTTLIKPQ